MTQIKKTLSIAGIIAMVGAPAMADIASTAYVQNIVNNMIPQSGTVGHVLKKTATGLEWAAAPTPTLETTTGQSTTATMTQKAITDALNAKLSNNATGGSIAIGDGANANRSDVGYDEFDDDDEWVGYVEKWLESVAIGKQATSNGGVAIGYMSKAGEEYALAVGNNSHAPFFGGTAIGDGAKGGEAGVAVGANTDSGSFSGVAIGYRAKLNSSVERSIAIGDSAKADVSDAIAIGYMAKVGKNADNAIQLGGYEMTNDEENTFKVGFYDQNYTLLDGNDGTIPYERFAPEIPNTCKAANNQTCALVIKWNSAQNKFTQSWEVVKIN